jgi:hypothetical protein
MRPDNLYFGGGVAETVLSPFVALALLIAGWMICVGSRRKALPAFLSAAVLIPTDQVLMLGSVHFPALRIVAMFGLVRALISRMNNKANAFSGGINKIDVALVVSMLLTAVSGTLLSWGVGALTYQMGNLVTLLGLYIGVRLLIRDERDMDLALKTFVIIAGIVGAVMTSEQLTGHNPYALLGGARASWYSTVMERDDRFRAVACFGHPILAGTFGVIMLPVFVGLWWRGRALRKYAIAGTVASVVIALASASSTPLMALVAAVVGFLLWPWRRWMRAMRWGLAIMLVCLHMVMKAPVWNLIARVDVIGGSSGEHRYELVNQFILHFSDWWLIGTRSNGDWGWDMWDTCNQYVAVGEAAGLVPFVLLLTVIVYGFKFLGRARKAPGIYRNQALFLWSLSVGIFANVVAFFGISYFDQTIVAWYALLAVSIAMTNACEKKSVLADRTKPMDNEEVLITDQPSWIQACGPSSTS